MPWLDIGGGLAGGMLVSGALLLLLDPGLVREWLARHRERWRLRP